MKLLIKESIDFYCKKVDYNIRNYLIDSQININETNTIKIFNYRRVLWKKENTKRKNDIKNHT